MPFALLPTYLVVPLSLQVKFNQDQPIELWVTQAHYVRVVLTQTQTKTSARSKMVGSKTFLVPAVPNSELPKTDVSNSLDYEQSLSASVL